MAKPSMGLMLLLLSFLSSCTSPSAQDAPACVLSASGKMLCCASNDLECVAKVQKAHGTPASSPPSVVEPQRPWLFGALHTFANATVWDRKGTFDVAVIGVPFGLEAGYEAPGMQLLRREASRIPPYSRAYGASLTDLLVVDGQDLLVGGADRIGELEVAVLPMFRTGRPVVALGGDQSISVPLLRAAKAAAGEFAMIHIDQDLATGIGSREQELTADTTMFWGAAEGLFDPRHSMHVAARGNLPSQRVELIDQEIGFRTLSAEDIAASGIAGAVARIRERLTRRDGTFMPAYISLDLDVLDPAFFPSEEVGGLSVTELRAMLAGLQPFCRVVGADIRGVAMLSDPTSIKIAAAVAHDLVLLAGRQYSDAVVPPPLKGEDL
eukprot:CAMPEP_0171187478 /NCGR_PEP_ID=MMETSP0790-20130122/17341_1 /TAXON_ID=2925 /ORGANISM="Alexandrium catenella, Strain OF101" /LENGTH=380 /DNA_ID=CAMNT_0011652539 /DNA_START=57 /DNA_END=1199 /DNA_ORIENTATION=-